VPIAYLSAVAYAWALAASFIIRAVQAGSIVAGSEGVVAGIEGVVAGIEGVVAGIEGVVAAAAAASLDTMRSTRTP
jgi:hypothetical protein